MIPIQHDERCECAAPRPTGRFYQGREACLCGKFIVTSRAEWVQLREAALAEDRQERLAEPVWPYVYVKPMVA